MNNIPKFLHDITIAPASNVEIDDLAGPVFVSN